jgi:hypothetical protein
MAASVIFVCALPRLTQRHDTDLRISITDLFQSSSQCFRQLSIETSYLVHISTSQLFRSYKTAKTLLGYLLIDWKATCLLLLRTEER